MQQKNKKKQKYWYVTEVNCCVVCGCETREKHRVHEKPKPQEKNVWRDFACWTHFI